MREARKIYKVTEINRYLKNMIQNDPRLQQIWVTGELSNFKHHRSGHMYFTVKDGASALRCVFFRRENSRIIFKPEDGMEVVLQGSISIYEPDGLYQFYVSEMEPAGMGSLYLAYEQLKAKLESEGLFRAEHKKKIPQLPRKIGIITSPSGAALQDIIATIRKRYAHVELLVVESLMQGSGAAEDIVRALTRLNLKKDIDLIILARGGGSLEDLWPFNEEKVARAIFKSSIPVISAIGHETDFTIADFVADLRAATPTAAAQAAVPHLKELLLQIGQLNNYAAAAMQRRLMREKQLLDHIISDRFFRQPVLRVTALREKLFRLNVDLNRETARRMQDKKIHLEALAGKLDSYSPLKVMSRGYSYCRDEEGRIVRSVHNLKPGRLLNLNFKDGQAECRVEKLKEENLIEETK